MSLKVDDDVKAGGEDKKGGDDRQSRRTTDERVERPVREEGANSIRTMGRTFGRALSRTTAGEALSKAYNAFDKLFHDPAGSNSNTGDVIQLDEYKVSTFDAQEYRADMSSVVLSYLLKDSSTGDQHAFYFTILVEGSTPGLSPVRFEDRNRSYEIPRTAGDVMNSRYADRVFDMVEGIYGKDVIYHDCGSNVLPGDIDIDKDLQAIRNLAFYANAAIETISVELLGYQPKFTLAWLERDDSLEVSVDWTGQQQYSAAGQPRRTDVKICITSNMREENGSFRDRLSRVGGSLELIYSPAAVASDHGFGARRRTEETEIVTPLFTITDLDTDYKAITLEMQLLGLASTAMLSDDLYWVNGFRPKPKDRDQPDYRDVGVLNYLMNGKYFDVKSSSVDTSAFLEYFGTLCRRDLAYAIDVEERGDNTWINSVFAEAAQGNENSLRRVFEAADNLTDNHFSSIYRNMIEDSRSPTNPFEESGNRIILGWFREGGEKYDLRHLDLLYWLNRRGESDPELALQWQDTYDMVRDPIELRIENRLRIIEDVLGAGNYKVTGYAQQVLINSDFIAALALAVKACDVRIDQSNTTNTYGNVRERGNSNIGRLAGANLGGGLFGRYGRRDDRDTDRRGTRFFTGRGR